MRLLRRSFYSLLVMTDVFRIYCDEIPRSSRGMTENASRGMTQGLGNFRRNFGRNFERDCSLCFAPRNDEF